MQYKGKDAIMAKHHPMQPLIVDSNKVVRFKSNSIVRFLLDNSSYDMNALAAMDFSSENWIQFAQLIGYSVSGFCDLSYVDSFSFHYLFFIHFFDAFLSC